MKTRVLSLKVKINCGNTGASWKNIYKKNEILGYSFIGIRNNITNSSRKCMNEIGRDAHLHANFGQAHRGVAGGNGFHDAGFSVDFVALARLNGLMAQSALGASFNKSGSDVPLERVLFNIQKLMQQVDARTLYGGTPAATQFIQEYKTVMQSHAVYIPFTVRPPPGHPTFTNRLFICDSVHGVPSSEHDKKIAKFHEAVHFAQWNESPVLHATPYNVFDGTLESI